MKALYVGRLRQLLETIRKLEPGDASPSVEQQLAVLETELQQAATEMTIQACRQEVERRGPGDRRQVRIPVTTDRRASPSRRGADLAAARPTRP